MIHMHFLNRHTRSAALHSHALGGCTSLIASYHSYRGTPALRHAAAKPATMSHITLVLNPRHHHTLIIPPFLPPCLFSSLHPYLPAFLPSSTALFNPSLLLSPSLLSSLAALFAPSAPPWIPPSLSPPFICPACLPFPGYKASNGRNSR